MCSNPTVERSGKSQSVSVRYWDDQRRFWSIFRRDKAYLVSRHYQRAYQTSNDHNLIEEDQSDDVGQRKTSGEDEFQKKEGRGDDPIDVSDIPDRSGKVLAVAVKFDEDRGSSEVGCHTVQAISMRTEYRAKYPGQLT